MGSFRTLKPGEEGKPGDAVVTTQTGDRVAISNASPLQIEGAKQIHGDANVEVIPKEQD